MEKKLISVIMPVYNVNHNYLEDSVNSILSQTYDDIELLVIVDRNHTRFDNDIISCLDNFQDDNRFKQIIHNKRKGFVDSLNEGIKISKGEYLARADGDDISLPKRLELQLDYLANGYYLTGSWAWIINEQKERIGELLLPVDPSTLRKRMMLHNMIIHGSVLMRRRILRDVGLYNSAFDGSEDYELWLRIISKGYPCTNYPAHLILLRENPFSVTRGKTWLKNRFSYIKSKAYASLNYGYKKPMDLSFLLFSFTSLLVYPSLSPHAKKLLGIYKKQNKTAVSTHHQQTSAGP